MPLASEQPDKVLEKIEIFLAEHHVMSLATVGENGPGSCSLFYAYCPETVSFVAASDPKTEHIRNVLHDSRIAASIALETKTVGKIQGLQLKGAMSRTEDAGMHAVYFRAFPYAKVLNPTLWVIRPESMKLTDNRLGFGKKLMWTRGASA